MSVESKLSGASPIGVRLIKMAVVYLVAGLLLGLGMAMSGDFQLRAVHTHINLLGWVTLVLSGMVYCQFPHLGETRLSNWHAWAYTLGLPVMMVALTAYHLGYTQLEPLLGIASLVTASGLILFAINLFKHIDGKRSEADSRVPQVVVE